MTAAHELLHKLLDLWEKNPDGSRKKSLTINEKKAPVYYATVDPVQKAELHDSLEVAAKIGAVSLTRGKFRENHLLKKITLEDPHKLANHLGHHLASDQADGYREKLGDGLPEDFPWGKELVDAILEKWRVKASYSRIEPGNIKAAKDLIHALWNVESGHHQGLDLRTFSAKALGNSKAMERIRDRFAGEWNKRYKTEYSEPRDLYEALGLCKFPPAIYIRGPLKVHCGEMIIDLSCAPAFIGIPPDTITGIELTTIPEQVGYVLTIENLASFNRHCREVAEANCGIVIFSSGFLNPQAVRVIQQIDTILPASVPFFHWGDIDLGGLNIFAHIDGNLDRELIPHLMTPHLLINHGTLEQSRSYKAILNNKYSSDAIRELASYCMEHSMILEQENVDPQLPTVCHTSQ